MIPGINLLETALRIIGRQPVVYYRDSGRSTLGATGRDITEYDPPIEIADSVVQPIPTSRVAQLGLDTQKAYITWWVPADALGIGRDIGGDQIEWNGWRWQCQSETDWYGQDGWKEVVCVRIGRAG